MKIGCYFGSFNPIHTGHCIIANYLANNTDLQQVWLIVSPQNPFKPAAALLNEYHRLHLVQTAIEGITALKASNIEFHLPKPSYTIDTLRNYRVRHPLVRLFYLIGADHVGSLPKWRESDELARLADFVVIPRPGEVSQPMPAPFRGQELRGFPLGVSSSRIRERIRRHLSIRGLVPDVVREAIHNSGLYL